MDPRETEALVQRLVQNPHDQDAITLAHQAGQSDPKAYALLLEKVGTATSDPAFACHWLTESANVWTTTQSEEHTSELQSQSNLVCRLLLEKKKKKNMLS